MTFMAQRFGFLVRLGFLSLIGFFLVPSAQPQAGEREAVHNLSLADALQATLKHNISIGLRREDVNSAQGTRREAAGAFDLNLYSTLSHSRTNTPLSDLQQFDAALTGVTFDSELSNLTSYEAGATRLFRNGIQVKQVFTLQRSVSTLDNPLGENTSHAGLSITLPLLRGRGSSVTGAQEKAAELQLAARQLQLRQMVSDQLAATASCYWDYVAALRSVKVANEAAQRGITLIENVKALIDADKLARAEQYQVTANYADRSAALAAAEQGVVVAREALATAMGVPNYTLVSDLTPTDDLPAIVEMARLADRADRYTGEALQRRADLAGAAKLASAARAQYTASQNALKPQVDLTFSTGYSGLRQGTVGANYFQALGGNAKGPELIGGISYQVAPKNDIAAGKLQRAGAAVRTADLLTRQIELDVRSSVSVALSATLNAAERWRSARQSVQSFEAALSGEREKFRLGSASITDVLPIEDRLTVASNTEINAHLSYALALVRLRAATGSLLPVDADSFTFDPDVFYTLPFEGSGRP
jgi:outer membrane protein